MAAEIISLTREAAPADSGGPPHPDGALAPRRRRWVYPALALGASAFLMVRRWGYAMDDPWITFRYGRNLAGGLGLVFNPGERLEGYSNFLLVLLSAALERLRLDSFDFVRLGGFCCLLASVALAAMGERRITADERSLGESPKFLFPGGDAGTGWWGWAGAFYLALSPQAATWAVGGLETAYFLLAGLATWLLAARTWHGPGAERARGAERGSGRADAGYELPGADLSDRSDRSRRADWGWGAATGVAALAAALARVDGFVVAGGLLAFAGWETIRRRGPRAWGPVLLAACTFSILYFAYNLWRHSYFGAWVPNTAQAKATGPLAGRLRDGALYLFDWARRGGGLGLLVALGGAAMMLLRWERTKSHGQGCPCHMFGPTLLRLAAWLGAAQAALILYAGGDWMPAARFVVPLLGFVGVLAGAGLRHWRRRGAFGWWAALISAVWIAFSFWHGDRSDKDLQWCLGAARKNELWQPLRDIGEWIGAVAPEDAWLAGTEAGIVPYYSRVGYIDMLGLVDRHIASLPGGLHEKSDADYVLDRAPRFILLGVADARDKEGRPLRALWPPDEQILRHPRFRDEYAARRIWNRPYPIPALMILYERRAE